MNLKYRIRRLENIVQPDDLIAGARALSKVENIGRDCSPEEIELIAKAYAQHGITLDSVMAEIAAQGPPWPVDQRTENDRK